MKLKPGSRYGARRCVAEAPRNRHGHRCVWLLCECGSLDAVPVNRPGLRCVSCNSLSQSRGYAMHWVASKYRRLWDFTGQLFADGYDERELAELRALAIPPKALTVHEALRLVGQPLKVSS